MHQTICDTCHRVRGDNERRDDWYQVRHGFADYDFCSVACLTGWALNR